MVDREPDDVPFPIDSTFGMSGSGEMQHESEHEIASDESRRLMIAGLSLVGMASMAATSLLQLGFVDDLPDPSGRFFGLPFDSKKVNLSDEAYVLGVRDGPIALAGFALNAPIVLLGRRVTKSPWLPLLFAAKALGEAIGAALFFSKMPRKERAWCGYCITGAIASTAIFALSVPEAWRAARLLLGARHGNTMRRAPQARPGETGSLLNGTATTRF